MKKVAVVGKGGVGKSFVVYGLTKALVKRGNRVLVIDSDESNQTLYKLFGFDSPPSAFMDFLGGKKTVQQSIIKRFQSGEKELKMSLIERKIFSIDDIPDEFIIKDDRMFLVSIGKIKEPMEGCACPMGVVIREFLDKIELKNTEIIIVDTEAGVEHFGRGIEKGIDTVIAVAEPYLDSIEVAEKALLLAQKMDKKVYFLLNKVPLEFEDKLKQNLQKKEIHISGIIHFSPEIYSSSIEGKIPQKTSIFNEIEEVSEKIWKNTDLIP
ncbi:AAA family ATPase [Thermodesulfovibrio thiophilus]|uniref:ATP-binding protein n=1 Tax=Thermodesulfovibrio thiophilus TaxID=340095 RepID=UPI0004164426|nr:AAA family ATPase [Thermodesulfovibrio thiophilus]